MMTTEYEFTNDWFAQAREMWARLIPMLPERDEDGRYFLEIGSFEGRSATWIAEHFMEDGDYLTCVDTWKGSEEHGSEDMQAVEDRFDRNFALMEARYPTKHFWKAKKTSVEQLASELSGGWQADVDFIYIDGSHTAKDVLTDACMAWPLLKSGGIMVFDDYLWGEARDVLHRPKLAIDAFVNIFAEELAVIPSGYQFIIKKR
jgi:predicted O-methyltransferase YrrM